MGILNRVKRDIKKEITFYKSVIKIKVLNKVESDIIEYFKTLCKLEEDLFYIETTEPERLHGYEYENKKEDIYNHMRKCKAITGYSWSEFKKILPFIADYFDKNHTQEQVE